MIRSVGAAYTTHKLKLAAPLQHWISTAAKGACSVVALISLLLTAHVAYAYSVIDLGPAGAGTTAAYRINEKGQVSGQAYFSGDSYAHGFFYDGDVSHDFGRFSGSGGSFPGGLNDFGVIAGYSGYYWRAFLWDSVSGMRGLEIPGTQPYEFAIDINNKGHIAAYEEAFFGDPTYSYIFRDGSWSQIPNLPGHPTLVSQAINDNDQVIGSARTGPWNQPYLSRAWIWDEQQGTRELPGLPGATITGTSDLNENGNVVGYSGNQAGSYHPVLWTGGGVTDLGSLGGNTGQALGINTQNDVVGMSKTADDNYHAFIFSSGAMRDLNATIAEEDGWILTAAYDINDAGQIVGYGINSSGQTRAFLLTPDGSEPPSSVPLPGTAWLVGSGLVSLGAARRRWN